MGIEHRYVYGPVEVIIEGTADRQTIKFTGWSDLGYKPIFEGWLSYFPGSALMISHGLVVPEELRRNGYSKAYDKAITRWCRENGKRGIVATVHVDNFIQHDRLTSLGWKCLSKTLWFKKVNDDL